ncbi:MAG: PP2C family serine/threonine-protein phosphatase [Lautropia sp.]
MADVAAPGFAFALRSDAGRRDRNEDACGHWQSVDHAGAPACAVLADGAGGHGGGQIAARTAVAAVLEAFAARPACDPPAVRTLIANANRAVIARQQPAGETRDMRSTLVVWVGDPVRGLAAWGHSGDSRLYRLRGGRVIGRTRDHSLVESLVDAGIVAESAARAHPGRSVLTTSLGLADGFEAAVVDAAHPILPGDAFLLCSDGFWAMLEDRTIEDALRSAGSPADWLERLAAVVSDAASADQDNYSALAIWYRDGTTAG